MHHRQANAPPAQNLANDRDPGDVASGDHTQESRYSGGQFGIVRRNAHSAQGLEAYRARRPRKEPPHPLPVTPQDWTGRWRHRTQH